MPRNQILKRQRNRNLIVFAVMAFIVFGAGVLIGDHRVNEQISSAAVEKSYFTPSAEFQEQNVLEVDGTTILVGRDCMAIVADTTPERAEAISLGLENRTIDRPNSWDGWASMLETYNITFEATAFYGKSDEAYLSRAIFRQGPNVLDLDMRPSDAIALALRTNTPVYINMTMLREFGKNIC